MAVARSNQVVFTNHTESPLTIATGETVWWESESDGVMTSEGTGGTGENTRVEYGLERPGWHSTTFRPSIHGFKFDHFAQVGTAARTIDLGITTLGVGDAHSGLCGGMAFASLDYYLSEMTIPQQALAPAGEGHPLFDYLVSRLIDSFDIPAFPRRLFGIMAPTHRNTDQGVLEPVGVMDGRSALMIWEAWPQIKRWIDAGVPTPICLLKVKDSLDPGDLRHNRQVLVWGYCVDGTALSLAVYDPNKPGNDGCTISLDIARTDVVIRVGANPPDLGPVHTFIPMAYQKVTPPAIA
jgi:hypothetical protein